MRVCTMISCVCCMQLLGTQIAWENSCFIVEILYFEYCLNSRQDHCSRSGAVLPQMLTARGTWIANGLVVNNKVSYVESGLYSP